MAKRRQIGFYSLKPIKRFGAATNLIYGERSNGKTYSVKQEVIDNLSVNINSKFVYLRRRQRQITRRLMKKVFEDIDEYAEKQLGDIIHFSTESGFYIERNDHIISIGWPMCVEDGTIGKGIPWNSVQTIMFEEFLEFDGEIEDEISKYLNIISTITRKREDVKIYLTANTIGGGKLSPYFAAYGIDPKKLKPGQMAYIKHENGATVAVHRTGSMNMLPEGVKEKNLYVGLDNNATVNMMMYGEWEFELCNIKGVDGIGWKEKRRLMPFYVTALGEVYELSVYESKLPVAFIRKINTQDGHVRKEIRYNFSYDETLQLANKNGLVPMFCKVNSLVDEEAANWWKTIKLCIEAKRCVFDTMSNGSDFLKIYGNL